MADVTSNSTLRRFVAGNMRGYRFDVPGGGTTEDSLTINARLVSGFANFRGSTAGSSSVPSLTLDGSVCNINQLAATTGAAYTVTLYAGR